MSTHTTSTIPAKDRRTRSLIRVLFGIYLFFFLYGPGSDTIALAHWHIAHGATNYNPLVGAILFTAMALWRHRSNIGRLLHGTENKFTLKKNKQEGK